MTSLPSEQIELPHRICVARGSFVGQDTILSLTTGQFYGCANLLASWAGKDAVCGVDLGSEATATSCGIRDLCV